MATDTTRGRPRPATATATTRGRPRSTTSMLLPSPTTPMAASLTPTGPPRVFTRGLLMLRPATAMPTTVTAMVTSPRTATDTTRGRPRPATVTATVTSPRTAMVTRTAMATTRGLLMLRLAMVTATVTSPRTAMATSHRTAMGTTRGRPRPATVTAMVTSPRTAMVTTATATTKLFQKEY